MAWIIASAPLWLIGVLACFFGCCMPITIFKEVKRGDTAEAAYSLWAMVLWLLIAAVALALAAKVAS